MSPRAPIRLSTALVSTLGFVLVALGCRTPELRPEAIPERPNILLIVADDLGYSDLGAYGSEIPTPNLDALAASGTLATDFYVASRGAPTRAMLLTGVGNHLAGFGASRSRLLPTQEGLPGYGGSLRPGVVTIATRLRNAGYHTCMAGKWEIGPQERNRPAERGFERSFVLHDAAASHWGDMLSATPGQARALFSEDGRVVTELPQDYFSTRFFTDFVARCIEQSAGGDRPFFGYLAYQAPHGPLAAPDDWRDRFEGRYDEGFDAIRDARLLRMKQMGLVRESVHAYPGLPTIPRWKELSDDQKRKQSRKMELYAAVVANLDFHVGRLIDYLEQRGLRDETLVVFLSDNGPEPGDRGPDGMDPRDRDWYAEQFPERHIDSWGRPGSFIEYGPAWAQVSTVPFRLFKGTVAEGGIRSPLIVSGPGVRRDRVTRALLHVQDLPATFLDLAGIPSDPTARTPGSGHAGSESLAPLLSGEWRAREGPNRWLGFAYSGDRALRKARWKLVRMPKPFGSGDWRLYRIDLDPAELFDRSERNAGVKRELIGLWMDYARRNGVYVPELASAAADDTSGAEGPAQNPSPNVKK